jgi:hypothetical protein
MPFDEARYAQDFLKKLRGVRALPDDLLERYAITLPATDPEISAQLKAVRAYWNKVSSGAGFTAQAAKMCRAEDERLRAQHGPAMEKQAWWQARQAERRSAAQESVTSLAEELRRTYGELGVVTAGAVGALSGKLGLGQADALQAAKQARLTVVDGVQLPDSPPLSPASFEALLKAMSECAVGSVPELVHPGTGPFSLIERYNCTGDPGRRLDAVAVEAQSAEADKRAVSATENARRAALKILRRAAKEGVDLRDIALYHLVKMAEEYVPPSMRMAAGALQKAGLERRDAAVIAVLLGDQSAASGAAGLSKVHSLLAAGRLTEARQSALTMPPGSSDRAQALKDVDAAAERLAALLAEVRRAVRELDEGHAATLLREAAAISLDDAEAERAAVPLAPPSGPRAVCDGETVKLFWQPAAGHDEGTAYVVTRSEQRPPAAPDDGSVVYRGPAVSCTDTRAPVARAAQYGIFAVADGRPGSRPAAVTATLLPPVSRLEAEVGPSEITVHWAAHPAAQEVRVTRSSQGAPLTPVGAAGNSCRLTGLPEGQVQHFEVTAVYHGRNGAELLSAAAQINATPMSEAQPIPRLRAKLVDVAGAARVRVSWQAVDLSEVRIMHSDAPPSWPFGTWVKPEDLARFGREVSGPRTSSGAETAIVAELPPGVHHLTPFSVGGTGIVMGRPVMVGVLDPVRHLVVTPFATYATVSWEWPPTAGLAELSWTVDDSADIVVIGQAQYRSQGGARVPLGRGPCTIEVRAMIQVGRDYLRSLPVKQIVEAAADVEIRYAVSAGPSLGPFGGRSKRVVFSCAEGCQGVHVQMVALPGRVMPSRAEDGATVLDTTLALAPGIPVEHQATVPRAIKRPYWVRCFVVGGRARLIDPPVESLKET